MISNNRDFSKASLRLFIVNIIEMHFDDDDDDDDDDDGCIDDTVKCSTCNITWITIDVCVVGKLANFV